MEKKRVPNVIQKITDSLRYVGYEPRRREVLALAGLLTRPEGTGLRGMLIEGPSGVGKSSFAEAAAKALPAELVVYQFHSWSDADELFMGVNVPAAVAGRSEEVDREGALLRASRLSHKKRVVLLLDEVDKTSERTEYLLLDWLQSGRIPIRPGVQENCITQNLLVIFTSNGVRELSDAFLRRVRRVEMQGLPVELQEKILVQRTKLDKGYVRIAWKAAREVAEREGNPHLSLQEGVSYLEELRLAETADDIKDALAGWAARSAQGRKYAWESNLISAIWGELIRTRKQS